MRLLFSQREVSYSETRGFELVRQLIPFCPQGWNQEKAETGKRPVGGGGPRLWGWLDPVAGALGQSLLSPSAL